MIVSGDRIDLDGRVETSPKDRRFAPDEERPRTVLQ